MSGPTTSDRPTLRPPIGLLGMLAMVAAIEATIAARHLDFTTIWADDWRRSAVAATRQARGRDVLCLGDSLVKFGVLPKEIEATTGLRSYNLAINAGTMPSSYFLLRRALESGARPRAIVADFCVLMQPHRPDGAIRLYPELATVRDCLDLAWTARDPGFLSAALLGKLLPSYKDRFEIRESVKAALDGRRASPWPVQSAIWTAWKTQDGAQPMPSYGLGPFPNPGLVADLSPDHWECDPINAAYFEKFLALAGSRKIPVFWLIPPLSPEVHARRALHKSDDAYDRFVRAALGRHPGVVVLDARRSGYDNSLYIDVIHLGQQGAKVLTRGLATLVRDRLEGRGPSPRWVEMPAFDPRTSEVARAGPVGHHQ
jgi:hypothetical protein